MKNENIFLLCNYDVMDSITGVVRQTATSLTYFSKRVIIIDIANPTSFQKFIKFFVKNQNLKLNLDMRDGILWFHPVLFPIISRLKIGYKISLAINFFVLCLWLNYKYSRHREIFWVFHPHIAYLIFFLPHSYYVLYDMVDYYTFYDRKRALWLENQKKFLLTRANFVCTISKTLKRLYAPFSHSEIFITPQGFDRPKEKMVCNGKKIIVSRHPVIGFAGSINERLDMKLLFKLVKNNPRWYFVFVGPIEHEPHVAININFRTQIAQLFYLNNVTHLPRQSRKIIYFLIKQFDICMIPYDVSQNFNKYCYPMKLFEYFYMGKPVISTPIEELKRFPKYVKIGESAKEWENNITELLSKSWPMSFQREQKEIAVENSWANKVANITSMIDKSEANGSI